MKGTKIRSTSWTDAYVAASRLEIRINHIVEKGGGKFNLEDKHGIEHESRIFG